MASFASKKVRYWYLVLVRPKRGADVQTPTTTRVVLINMVLLMLKYACAPALAQNSRCDYSKRAHSPTREMCSVKARKEENAFEKKDSAK